MDLVTGSYSAKVIENFQRLDKYMEEDDRWKQVEMFHIGPAT